MKNCEHFETQLSTWVDDRLERREQIECLDHVVRCDSCREFYLDARALDGLVAQVRTPVGAEDPSPEVWQRIQWVTRKQRQRSARSRIPLWALQAAAVVVVAVGLSVVVWNGGSAPAPDQAEIMLSSNPDMTETRFIELTKEVMQADRRYHSAMYRIMEQVVRDTGGNGEESSDGVLQRSEEFEPGESAESAGRAPA
jgi:predicted anti-sigma-YlaC factor YlaD